MCKPCFGDFFELGTNDKRIAVMALPSAFPSVSTAIEVEGTIGYSRGSYAVNPCVVRAKR